MKLNTKYFKHAKIVRKVMEFAHLKIEITLWRDGVQINRPFLCQETFNVYLKIYVSQSISPFQAKINSHTKK